MTRRFRGWRLRTLLIAVASIAAMLGWVRFEMTRPHPTGCYINGAAPPVIIWSDHKMHDRDRGPGIYPVYVQFGRMVSRLKWSDGAITHYLHWPGTTAYSNWP